MVARSSLFSLPLAIASFVLAVSADDNCYWRSDNQVHAQPGWTACNNTQVDGGKARLCCFAGTTCGEDSLCRSNSNDNLDIFYLGGCTDSTYADPVCRPDCSGDSQTWVKWNVSEKLWHCCGDNGCLGGAVTPTTFTGISPQNWSALPKDQIVTSSSSSSSATTPATATATPTTSVSQTPSATASPSTSPSSGAGLSSGAVAGIGVACGVAGLALIAGVVFLFIRNRRKNRAAAATAAAANDHESSWQDTQQEAKVESAAPQFSAGGMYKGYNNVPQNEVHEAPGYDPLELSGEDAPQTELPGDETFKK
ncbi:Hypothetical protein R9X50_00201300 [Acrodontium crateriforme]|uniref:Uncharacterized protein n=1 Tax=Acrodontium crateriforme TaxID=150365 RepID=A0AAQ3RAJ9_9PEZI|nr:Hypothetical protein R9X50_00201300 [Acrodontium crateriforme]